MNKPFVPSFQHFHKDIERYLKSEVKCETNEYGQTVYRGYQAAVEQMFRAYMQREAFAPLVAEFRTWNWEWGYSDYLLDLTAHLRHWRLAPSQGTLGSGRGQAQNHYDKTQRARRALPERIPEALVMKTRQLSLDSLRQLRHCASELQRESDVGE